MILKFDLESQESTDTTEALHELEALLRLVRDELELRSILGIVIADPLSERLSLNDVVGDLGLRISKGLSGFFLGWGKNKHLGVALYRVLEHISVSINVFIEHNCF
jgi:hypothetical protein